MPRPRIESSDAVERAPPPLRCPDEWSNLEQPFTVCDNGFRPLSACVSIRPQSNLAPRGLVLTVAQRAPDPYTGTSIRFVYGGASEVDIDHVVAISDAWQKGAAGWVPDKRLALANDPLNPLAVDSSANRSKGDGDAATWLPPNKSFRCTYVARQVAVKSKYGVWVTAAERDAMNRVLPACPPVHGLAGVRLRPIVAALPRTAPRPAPAPVQPAPAQPPAGSIYYENCTAARAAGAAPIMRGEPGYASKLDRDNDGAACE